MSKILLVGNPNVGKTTLFNSLTKSSEHTGNFHGVTVEEKSKTVKLGVVSHQIIDLPGLYSLNCNSFEEEVSRVQIMKRDGQVLVVVDANSLKRNLYLCLQLKELKIDYKIIINNYDFFVSHGGKLDEKKLSEYLGCGVQIVNAKKVKFSNEILENKTKPISIEYLDSILKDIKQKSNLSDEKIIAGLNGIYDGLNNDDIIEIKSKLVDAVALRYKKIDNILSNCLVQNENQIYGYSKLDRFILNPVVSLLGFLIFFFLSVYLIFFLIGPFVSEKLSTLINIVFSPIINFLYQLTDNIWLLEFFSSGVMSAFTTVLCFLPQVVLLFVFLTLLEDSGLISRLAFSFDDFLSKFGLNGKAVYIMLLGLGCNTMSCVACRSMSDKNMRAKTILINPNISCMARLPVFVLVASAFFGPFSYLFIVGLYLLGFLIALVLSLVLNKTLFPSKNVQLLLEFPPIRNVDFNHIFKVTIKNAVDFFKRVFGVVFSVGIIVWILTHTNFSLTFTQDITTSILFVIAGKLSFLLSPIGLNNAGIVCALIVGVMAKELIVSTFSIINGVTDIGLLSASLLLSTSAINFSFSSAVSFLIFSLLYLPCISNLTVIKHEIGQFNMWLCVLTQLTISYVLASIVYISIEKGIIFGLIFIAIASIIIGSFIFIIKKVGEKTPTCKLKTNNPSR